MKAESLLLVREVGSWCPLFFLGLRSGQSGADLGLEEYCHRVFCPFLVVGPVAMCPRLSQRLG